MTAGDGHRASLESLVVEKYSWAQSGSSTEWVGWPEVECEAEVYGPEALLIRGSKQVGGIETDRAKVGGVGAWGSEVMGV